MRKNDTLTFIENNNYDLRELRGAPVPVFKLSGPENDLTFFITGPGQYHPNRQPTELEQEMINRIFQELQANELKFIYYDFSLDNNE
jgi:hypothetical protein